MRGYLKRAARICELNGRTLGSDGPMTYDHRAQDSQEARRVLRQHAQPRARAGNFLCFFKVKILSLDRPRTHSRGR